MCAISTRVNIGHQPGHQSGHNQVQSESYKPILHVIVGYVIVLSDPFQNYDTDINLYYKRVWCTLYHNGVRRDVIK